MKPVQSQNGSERSPILQRLLALEKQFMWRVFVVYGLQTLLICAWVNELKVWALVMVIIAGAIHAYFFARARWLEKLK
jgi:hypothetical protein